MHQQSLIETAGGLGKLWIRCRAITGLSQGSVDLGIWVLLLLLILPGMTVPVGPDGGGAIIRGLNK